MRWRASRRIRLSLVSLVTMSGRLSPLFAVAIAVATLDAAQPTPGAGVVVGRVVEEGTNTPIADARVSVMLMVPPTPGQIPQPHQATTSADGTFRVEGLAPGRYRITAQKS